MVHVALVAESQRALPRERAKSTLPAAYATIPPNVDPASAHSARRYTRRGSASPKGTRRASAGPGIADPCANVHPAVADQLVVSIPAQKNVRAVVSQEDVVARTAFKHNLHFSIDQEVGRRESIISSQAADRQRVNERSSNSDWRSQSLDREHVAASFYRHGVI